MKILDSIKKVHRTFILLYRGHRTALIGLFSLGLVGGMLEGLGVSALIPLFSFITGGEGLGTDAVSETIRSVFDALNFPFKLWSLLLFIAGLFVLKALILLWYMHSKAIFVAKFESRQRGELYREIMNADWPFLSEQKLGHIENTLMVDLGFTVVLLDNLLELARIATSFIIYFTIALIISPSLTLVSALSGFAVLMAFRPLLLRSRLYANYKSVLNKNIAHYINEQMVGLKTIKSLNIVEPLTKIGLNYFDEIKRLRVKQALIKNLTKLAVEPALIFLVLVVFVFSYYQPGFSLGAFVATVFLVERIFLQVDKAQRFIHTVFEAASYANNAINLKKSAHQLRENITGQKPFVFNQSLVFNKICFSYNSDNQTLCDLDLKINRGEIVTIVGRSGAGKTTLVDLLLRLLKPQKGQILLDSTPIAEIDLTKWRHSVSYVPQEPFLINDTIEKNIRFFDDQIDEGDIKQAVKDAHIEELVAGLPLGLKTIVGERGSSLSGGERQRVVLARALARQPKILVLDEATSALDTTSEEAIVDVLSGLRGKLTIIIITHRPALTKIADRVLTLENGKII